MTAIYKKELKSFFHSFIGWLYLAVMLFMMGIYFMVLNMLSGYPTISYVLQSVVFLLLITVPILTMRTFAEERKYKTDQLILTAPVPVWKIVMGKYLALVTVSAIPMFVIGLTPVFLMRAGEFQTGTSYTALLGFFLYGCLGLAVGLFLSSLTESIVISAVLSFAAMFLGYIMSGLSNVIASSGTSAVAEYIAKFLLCFDMVGRFDSLCNGYFQMESVAYYVTATAFVLFCTTQSIQKRRYAVAGRGIKLGAYSIVNILAAAVVTIAVNIGLNYVPDQYTSIDVTANKLYTLTEDTINTVSGLSQDVTIHVLSDTSSKDTDLDRTLQQMQGLSKHIKVEYVDPVANPKFYYKYTDTEPTRNSLIVVGPSGDMVVDYNDIYAYEPNYTTYSYEVTGYDGEGQILAAIMRVTMDETARFYMISGHDELIFDEKFLNALDKENVTYEALSLHTVDQIPEDAAGVILNALVNDYAKEDTEKLLAYLEQGGNALIIPTWTGTDMTQFERIMGYYDVSVVDGVIAEGDRSRYYQNPYNLFPEIVEGDLTDQVAGGTVFAPLSRGLRYPEEAENIRYQPFLMTSDNSFSKTDMLDADNYRKGDADIDGPFVIGLKVEKPTENGAVSQAVIVASEQIFTGLADEIVPGYNLKLFGSVIAGLADHEESLAIPVKYYAIGYLAFNAQTVYAAGFVSVILLPVLCLINGLLIWLGRRRK